MPTLPNETAPKVPPRPNKEKQSPSEVSRGINFGFGWVIGALLALAVILFAGYVIMILIAAAHKSAEHTDPRRIFMVDKDKIAVSGIKKVGNFVEFDIHNQHPGSVQNIDRRGREREY